MDISWSQLKPKQFEQLCCLILEANDFTDIQWFGESGNDKGRDILAKKIEFPWEERDLLREVYKHKRHIAERMPQIYGQSDPVFFYHLRGNEISFACNEFEEISIVVMNHSE